MKLEENVNECKKINFKQFDGLIQKELTNCFKKHKCLFCALLAPCHFNNYLNGIKIQYLDPLIMTFSSEVNGVIISYSNIQVKQDKNSDIENDSYIIGKIQSSSSFIELWIEVDLVTWCPQVGSVLRGLVYIQTPSHIGLLIHDIFNASIKNYNMPNNWRFNSFNESKNTTRNKILTPENCGYWTDDNGTMITGNLKFIVKSIQTSGKIISLVGSLIDD